MIKLLEHVGAQQRGELSFGKMGIQKAAWQSCYNALISKNISFNIEHSAFNIEHSTLNNTYIHIILLRIWSCKSRCNCVSIVSCNCIMKSYIQQTIQVYQLIHYAISQSMPVISHKSNWLHNISSYSIHNITTINSILCYCITNSLYNIM